LVKQTGFDDELQLVETCPYPLAVGRIAVEERIRMSEAGTGGLGLGCMSAEAVAVEVESYRG